MSIASAKRKIFERYRKGLQKAFKESECNRHFFYDAHGNTVYTSKTKCLYCKIELLEQQFQQARQEVAKEVVEIMGGWPVKNSTLADLRGRVIRHFRLEGVY